MAKDKWIKGKDIMKRSINKIGTILENSLVSIPAYDATDVRVATRSLEEAVNELEKQRLEVELELLGL